LKPLPAILAFALLFAGCGRRGDADIRGKLPGTWLGTVEQATGGYKFSSTLEPTGRFRCRYWRGTNVLDEEAGTWEVLDGVLIETTTWRLTTNATLPYSLRYRVIRIDDKELVATLDPPAQPADNAPETNEFRFRRAVR
jgi:hypothetical protein